MNIALNSADFAALSPLLIVLVGALVLLLIESFAEKIASKICVFVTLATLLAALYASYFAPVSNSPLLTPWLRFDHLAMQFNLFFLLIALGCTLLASAFFSRYQATEGEYYFLLLSGVFGLMLVGSSADFLTLFLGIETLSISLYVSVGYMKKWELSHEAAIKYFLIGAIGAAFLLYGIALLYGAVGTTQFHGLLEKYQGLKESGPLALFFSGIALITLGFAFKAAIVPFHFWAPDVYAGAPMPVTAFMAVGTKVGAFAAFVVVFFIALPQFNVIWNEGLTWLAYATLLYANFVATQQIYLRRFFAYSGISHAGFLLIPLIAGTPEALSALLFYMVVYSFATLGSFAVLAFIDSGKDGVELKDLKGLFRRAPFLAIIFALCSLTLAGIPPTVGFFAKFYLFKVAFQAGYYPLVIVALIATVIAAYAYLRMVAAMLSGVPEREERPVINWPAALVGGVAFVMIILLSFYPAPMMQIF